MKLMAQNPLLQAYSGGAVLFDTRPFMQHFAQLQAKQAAKRDALDKYYTEQVASITPTGVRDQDLRDMKNPDGTVTPGWMTKFNEFKNYGIANKAKLLKGDYEAVSNFNRMKNELTAGQELSKRAADKDKMGFDYRTKNDHVTDDDLNILNDNSKSIYDPTRQNLDFAGLSFGKAPLDVHKWLPTIQGNYKRGTIQASPDVVDDKKGLRTATTHDVYSPENIKAMADMGAADVIAKGKNSAEWNYFDKIYHDKDQFPLLQKAFSEVYPQGGVIDSPAKAAAAYTILQNSQPTNISTKTTEYESPAAKEARERKKMDYEHGLRVAEIKLRDSLKDKSAAQQQLGIDAYLTGLEKNAGQEHQIDFLEPNGKKVVAKEIPATSSFIKSFERLDKYGQKVQPTAVYYANGNYYPIFPVLKVDPKTNAYAGGYATDANGNMLLDKSLSKPIRRADVKVNYSNTILPPKMVAETLEEGDDTMSGGGSSAPKAPSAPKKTIKPTKGMFD